MELMDQLAAHPNFAWQDGMEAVRPRSDGGGLYFYRLGRAGPNKADTFHLKRIGALCSPNVVDDATGGLLFAKFCDEVGGDVTLNTGRGSDGHRRYRINFAGQWLEGPWNSLGEASAAALLWLWER